MNNNVFIGYIIGVFITAVVIFIFTIFGVNIFDTRDTSDPAYHATADEVHEHMEYYDLEYEIINTVPCYRNGSTGQLVKITNDNASHFEVYCSMPKETCVGTMEDPLCEKIPMTLIGNLRSYEPNLK